jgi:hypothetical protein
MTFLVQRTAQTVKDNVAKVIISKDDVVELREVEHARQAWAELQPILAAQEVFVR